MWTLWNYDDAEPLILSSPEADEITIAELAVLVASSIRHPGPIEFDTSRSDGQYRKTASTAHLEALHHGIAFTPLVEGLQQTASWLEQNYPNVRT